MAEDPKAIAVGEKQTHFTKVPQKVPLRFHAAEWILVAFQLKINHFTDAVGDILCTDIH